jgi:beta-glucosidase/6-phospho-beta-glucosidase/beta-galactosidase
MNPAVPELVRCLVVEEGGGHAVVLALALVAGGCGSSSSAPPQGDAGTDAGPPPPAEVTFPAKFLWGTATAAFQVEKGDSHTDWAHWVAIAGKVKNGDLPDVGGPDALNHEDDDVGALKSSGQNAYRFSIEWARLYPTLADFTADTPDPAGIASYDALLTKLQAAGITPVVTLMHFALPDYLDDVTQAAQPQGWEQQMTSDLFVQYCSRIAKRWGDKIDYWVTLNEPLVNALLGYLQASYPPGVFFDINRTLAVVKAEARVHTRAYDAIHAADTVDADGDGSAALVSIAAHQRTFHPEDPTSADDVAATQRVEYLWNRWFFNVIVKGDWDDDFDGNVTGPNDKQADPSLKGRADYLGVNYYSDTLISAHRGIIIPVINAAVQQDHLPTGRPETDTAWDIYPEGFGAVLDEAASYQLPILVTENGLADRNDENRPRFLAEHLYQLGWAIQRGAIVRGYMHWALMDNFEWISGFCPKFGFFSVDPVTAARTARPSAALYGRIVQAGKVSTADILALPPYAPPTLCN